MPNIKCFMMERTDDGKWRRSDTGEVCTRPNVDHGAMWELDADYADGVYRPGPDGRVLAVQTPGGMWVIDSRASNCGRPDDNVHKCWVRHGEAPELTVDKNGDTCSAGAGSIQCGPYHGFLRGGYLVD